MPEVLIGADRTLPGNEAGETGGSVPECRLAPYPRFITRRSVSLRHDNRKIR